MSYLGINFFENSLSQKFSEHSKELFENQLRARVPLGHFTEKTGECIKDVAIGPRHLAILSTSGYIARVQYTLVNHVDSKVTPKSTQKPSNPNRYARLGPNMPSATSERRILNHGFSTHSNPVVGDPDVYNAYIEEFAPRFGLQPYSHRRLRIEQPSEITPAQRQDIPQHIIDQVRNILQGYDTSVITAELMRNRLDVNSTVNAILNNEESRNRAPTAASAASRIARNRRPPLTITEVPEPDLDTQITTITESETTEHGQGSFAAEFAELLGNFNRTMTETVYPPMPFDRPANRSNYTNEEIPVTALPHLSRNLIGSHNQQARQSTNQGDSRTENNQNQDNNSSCNETSKSAIKPNSDTVSIRVEWDTLVWLRICGDKGLDKKSKNDERISGDLKISNDSHKDTSIIDNSTKNTSKTSKFTNKTEENTSSKASKENCKEKTKIDESIENITFKSVACMFSNIYGVTTTGYIYQWNYEDENVLVNCNSNNDKNSSNNIKCANSHHFIKAKGLQILNEQITELSCSFARASALTKSDKIVTWMDSYLTNVTQLETIVTISSENKSAKVIKINVNNFYSLALMDDGTLWWWGAMPHESRGKTMNAEMKKSKKSGSENKIEIGSFVTHKTINYVPSGSLAFYCDNIKLKMGKLHETIYSYRGNAKFIPINNSQQNDTKNLLTPTTAYITADGAIEGDTSLNTSKTPKAPKIIKSSRKRKHSQTRPELAEEVWDLKDVIFLHESCNEIGQVVKIDQDNVLVEFSQRRRNLSKNRDIKDVCRLKNSRIMNIKDLKVIKHIPRKKSLPHYQATPRKVEYGPNIKVLGIQSLETFCNVFVKLEDNIYATDVLIPGHRISESKQLDQKASQFIPENAKYVDINVINDCLILNFPEESNSLVLVSDHSQFYSLMDYYPTIPQINLVRSHTFGKSNYKIILYTHSHFVSLAPCEANFMSHYIDNIYYKNQNILHMLAQLSFVTEVSYQNHHFSFLQDRFKELIAESNPEKIKSLFLHKDFDGFNPFLYAIKIRSYKFALFFYSYIQETKDHDFLVECTYNPSLGFALNPLYLLCTNENCTYTWTRNVHTPQDIYECRTCGITDNLCLCTECMTSCHRGHDCIKKERSQSAFCDCWQKCICSSLILGDQPARKHLFRLLMKETHLLNNLGSGNEHLLLLVVRYFSRQSKNFKDYMKIDSIRKDIRDILISIREKRQNIHGFPLRYSKKPGKFIMYALKLLLTSKEVLTSLFTTVEQYDFDSEAETTKNIPYFSSSYELVPSQSCGKLFDSFLFTLFTKCDKNVTSILFKTIKNSFSDEDTINFETSGVLVNFIRSCIRLYVVIVSTMAPMLLAEASKKLPSTNDQYRVLYRLVVFFKKFPLTSIIQMCKMSVSIVSPIIYGSLAAKPNSHPLFTKMSEVNDYVSGYFNAVQTSISSIKPKKTISRGTLMIDAENLINSQSALLEEDNEVNFSDDDEEDDDDEEEEDDDQEQEYFDSDESDYTNFSTLNDDDDPTNQEFGSENIDSLLQEPTIIVEADYDSHGTSPSEANSSRNRNTNRTLTPTRRRQASPFYFQRNPAVPHRLPQAQPIPVNSYQWAVRNNSNAPESRMEGMTVLRSNTETYNEGHALLLNTQTGLARSFMILVKLISDLCTQANFFSLENIFDKVFEPTIGQVFLWLFDSCERIEAKLRFGLTSIANSVPNLQSGRFDYDFTQFEHHELSQPSSRIRRRAEDRSLSFSNKNRSEFLSNLISLMRCHDNDHDGILPYVDLSGFRHLAYILDGISYFLASYSNTISHCDSFIKLGEYSLILTDGLSHSVATDFFNRTSSTLTFSNFTSLMTPLHEAIPLAIDPSLLKANSLKKNLFTTNEYDVKESPITGAGYDFSSFRLFSSKERENFVKSLITSSPHVFYVRWYHTFDTFSQIFAESISAEPASVFREICKYESKETSFRQFLDKFKNSCNGEIIIEHADRKPEKLMVQTFKLLNTYFQKRDPNKNSGYMFSRLKASFKNEPGEGSGVTRNFISAIFEAIRTIEKLPDLAPIVDINITTFARSRGTNITNVGEGSFFLSGNFREDEIDSPAQINSRFVPRMTTYTRNPLPRTNVPHRTWSDSAQEGQRSISQNRRITDPIDNPSSLSGALILSNTSSNRESITEPHRVRIFNEMLLRGDINQDNPTSRSSNQPPISNRARRASMSSSTNNADSPIALNQIEDMARNPNTPSNAQLESRIRIMIKKDIIRYIPAEIVHPVLESIIQLSPDVLHNCLNNSEFLKTKVESIIRLIGGIKENYKISYGLMEPSIFHENSALFFQPGKPGFYFPVNARKTFLRLNAYKNVGRLIGLALIVEELIPFILCRPVIKFLLDRPISFHDFAFYDPVQYESLRLLKIDAQEKRAQNPDTETNLHDLNFCITIIDCDQKPHTVELIPGGYDRNVTTHNVDLYIQSYVEYYLINSVKQELTAMREGLYEAINPFPFKIFSPEDFRLLVNGTMEINIELMKKIVTFQDETSSIPTDKLQRFQTWFWEVIESFDDQQKSDLLLFWTSSPLLNETNTSRRPNVIVKAPNDHLPTSNTCVMRLYIPCYQKKSILRSKLLMAIKTKSFGFI